MRLIKNIAALLTRYNLAGPCREGQQQEVEFKPDASHAYGVVQVKSTARTHFRDLVLSPELFPILNHAAKPDNKEFLNHKRGLIDDAFGVIQGHYSFVCGLKGLSNRKDLKQLVEVILRDFIGYFWDMPSSAKHHHSEPWGHLIHSLNTACASAEKASVKRMFTQNGVDIEGMHKFHGLSVVAKFCVSLFHDAHKIFAYKLWYESPFERVEYEPLRGGVLNFKSLFSTHMDEQGGSIREDWVPPPRMSYRYNLLLMLELVPKAFVRSMPQEMFLRFIDDFMQESEKAMDQEDVQDYLSGPAGEDVLNRLYADIREFCRDERKTKVGESLFRFGTEWVAVDFKKFFSLVSKEAEGFRASTSIALFLSNKGYLSKKSAQGRDVNSEQLKVQYLQPDGTLKSKKMSTSFLPVSFMKDQLGLTDDDLKRLAELRVEVPTTKESILTFVGLPLAPECIIPDESDSEESKGEDSEREAGEDLAATDPQAHSSVGESSVPACGAPKEEGGGTGSEDAQAASKRPCEPTGKGCYDLGLEKAVEEVPHLLAEQSQPLSFDTDDPPLPADSEISMESDMEDDDASLSHPGTGEVFTADELGQLVRQYLNRFGSMADGLAYLVFDYEMKCYAKFPEIVDGVFDLRAQAKGAELSAQRQMGLATLLSAGVGMESKPGVSLARFEGPVLTPPVADGDEESDENCCIPGGKWLLLAEEVAGSVRFQGEAQYVLQLQEEE